MRSEVRYIYRGETQRLAAFEPTLTLLDHLRLHHRDMGVKEGCNEGDCGACTVVLSRLRNGRLTHEAVNSCILLAGQVDGAEVLTVGDLARDGHAGAGALHPVQQAMVARHGSQCGFCTPGIVMSLFALHQDGLAPDRALIDERLAGNLCRCTGYKPIVDAARDAAAVADARWTARKQERKGALEGFTAFPPPLWGRVREGAEEAVLNNPLPELRSDLPHKGGGDSAADLFIGTKERFFAAPASLDALAALAESFPDATLVAGATDVGLWITKRLQDLPRIIWLGRVAGLDAIEDGPEALTLGATVTHEAARPFLGGIDPDLGALLRRFGGTQVRNSGTVGGSLANASPIGDLAPAFIALGAALTLRLGGDERTLPLERYFLAYGKQDRRPGEWVRGVTVRKLAPGDLFRCYKVSKRFDDDISAVMGAFRLSVQDGVVQRASVAFGGMAGTPKRAAGTEGALAGVRLDEERSWRPALDALRKDFTPLDDMRASAAYRLATARALLTKALIETASGSTRSTRLVDHRDAA